MEIIYQHHEGSQSEKPLEFDATTSKTVVYLRKNIERVTKEDEQGNTYEMWEYDEAIVPMSEFAAVASTIVSSQAGDISDAQEAIGETYDAVDANSTDITDMQEAIAEIYEMIAEV